MSAPLGAHQGVVALALAHIVGESGLVVAAEAMPLDARAAQRNSQLNGYEHLTVINLAVAARPGSVEFVLEGRAAWGDATQPTINVVSTTIDELACQYGVPDVLFIDVDGFETQALSGAQTVLDSMPDCYVEVHSELLPRYGQSASDVIRFFVERDYKLLVSGEMRESQREFVPIDCLQLDLSRTFHMLAVARDTAS